MTKKARLTYIVVMGKSILIGSNLFVLANRMGIFRFGEIDYTKHISDVSMFWQPVIF